MSFIRNFEQLWLELRANAALIIAWAACLLLVALLGALLNAFDVLRTPLDHLVYDAFLRHKVVKADDSIAIIEIDDKSIAQLGQWPWSRTAHARLIQQLNQSHPKALFLDIFFTENATEQDADTHLFDAFKAANKVVLPALMSPKQGTMLNLSDLNNVNVYKPIPLLADVVQLGHVANQPDGDNVIRYVDMDFTVDKHYWRHAMSVVANVQPAFHRAMIPYANVVLNSSFKKYSYIDVLNAKVPLSDFEDKYVLIGATATGIGDINKTPLGLMPGVEIHANILSALLQGQFIQPLAKNTQIFVELLVLTALMLAFLVLSERWHFIVLLASLLLVNAISFYLLFYQQIWMTPVVSVISLILAYMLWSWWQLSTALSYLKKQLTDLLSNSPLHLVDSKLHHAQRLNDIVRKLELLNEKQRKTETYNEELIEFLSHDMRTPQVNILAALSVFKKSPSASIDGLFEQIQNNVSHTLNYAQSLIRLNRIHTMPANVEDCNLYHLVSSACEQIFVQAQQKDIKLKLSLGKKSAEPEWVHVDGALIERAFINILSNAIRYSPKGSIIQINVTKETIDAQEFGVISIIDQGEGIDLEAKKLLLSGEGLKKMHKQVFEDGTTSLGIGWRIVHSIIVQKHHGILDIQSEQGANKGTEVIVKLLLTKHD